MLCNIFARFARVPGKETDASGVYMRVRGIELVSSVGFCLLRKSTRMRSIHCQILEVTRDEDAFNAMVCNLGVVGVLIEVTFDVVDDIYMTTIQMAGKVDDVLTDLAFQYDNEDYPFWRIDWVPSSEYGLVWAAREIPPNPDKPDNDYPTIAYIPLLKKLAGIQPQPFLGEVLKVVYGVLEVLIKRSDPLVVEGPLRNMLPVDRWACVEKLPHGRKHLAKSLNMAS